MPAWPSTGKAFCLDLDSLSASNSWCLRPTTASLSCFQLTVPVSLLITEMRLRSRYTFPALPSRSSSSPMWTPTRVATWRIARRLQVISLSLRRCSGVLEGRGRSFPVVGKIWAERAVRTCARSIAFTALNTFHMLCLFEVSEGWTLMTPISPTAPGAKHSMTSLRTCSSSSFTMVCNAVVISFLRLPSLKGPITMASSPSRLPSAGGEDGADGASPGGCALALEAAESPDAEGAGESPACLLSTERILAWRLSMASPCWLTVCVMSWTSLVRPVMSPRMLNNISPILSRLHLAGACSSCWSRGRLVEPEAPLPSTIAASLPFIESE